MKRIVLFLILSISGQSIIAQTAYIQISGESGLSVYLNNQFKGKTSSEYNGFIIENVPIGQNVIRIVKAGFTPYEETITVKKGEVFAYKVKPFAKHLVEISEKGNGATTEKKAVISTGKLVVQSIPIEIKITIPDFEDGNGISKTMDQWMANEVPIGSYQITFAFNQKKVDYQVSILKNTQSEVFVNMLNGEVTVKYSALIDEENEKRKKELAEKEERLKKEWAEENERQRKELLDQKRRAERGYQ